MDRTKAMDRIKKLLAIVNDRAASESEKDTALTFAKKLADANGIEIKQRTKVTNQVNVKNNTQNYVFNHYSFHLNCYNSKLVRFILYKLEITNVGYDRYKKEVYFSTTKDFNVKVFQKYYKMLAKVFYDTKKDLEWSGREYTDWFIKEFENAYDGKWCNYYGIERMANHIRNFRYDIIH